MTDPNQPFTPDLSASRLAQQAWAERPLRHRLTPIRAFRQALARDLDRIAKIVDEELGKSRAEVLATEILPATDGCRYLERNARSILRPRRIGLFQTPLWLFGSRDRVVRRPHGVVGIIGTWNYPINLNVVQIAQALAAGNAVVWKPSEVVPRTSEALHGLFLEAGVPEALLVRMPATREAGAQLAEADIDHLVFTGSAQVGRRLAARLGERLISSTLELSGCDAMFVFADADIDLAVRAAWYGATLNRGQTCVATRRLFVHRSAYAAVLDGLRARVLAASPVQLATEGPARQMRQLVADAATVGATVLTAPNPEANMVQPTVVAGGSPDASVWREASFAPLLAVMPFDDVESALAIESKSPYALGAAIFTRDQFAGEQFAARLRAGLVTVNDTLVAVGHPATPLGGRGASGWGVTQGAEGLLAMTVPQVISVRSGLLRPHFEPMVDGSPQTRTLEGWLQWKNGTSLGSRLAGLWRVAREGRAAFKPTPPTST